MALDVGLGRRLRMALLRAQVREGQRITLEELSRRVAALLGVQPFPRGTISRWMRANRQLPPAVFLAFCEALGADPREVAGLLSPDEAALLAQDAAEQVAATRSRATTGRQRSARHGK